MRACVCELRVCIGLHVCMCVTSQRSEHLEFVDLPVKGVRQRG